MTDPATVEVPFEIGVETRAGHTIVTVAGEVDVFTAPQLRQVLFDPVLCSKPRIVVDLVDVAFMDSTGIGTLVAARRWASSRDAELSLVCGDGPTLRLIEMVSLDRVFELHESVEVAVQAAG